MRPGVKHVGSFEDRLAAAGLSDAFYDEFALEKRAVKAATGRRPPKPQRLEIFYRLMGMYDLKMGAGKAGKRGRHISPPSA